MILVAGEALVDCAISPPETASQNSLSAPMQFRGTVGGGPFNTAIASARLGAPTYFLSAISDDPLGEKIMETLRAANVKETLIQRNSLPTLLAMVTLDKWGNAQYTFYLDSVSNTQLSLGIVHRQLEEIGFPDIVFTGTLGLVIEPSAEDLVELCALMHNAGKIVVVDPNIRTLAVRNPKILARRFARIFKYTSIIKLSDEDAEFFTNEKYYPLGSELDPWLTKVHNPIAKIPENTKIQAVLLTHGSRGASLITRDFVIHAPTIAPIVVDTIGAGDSVDGSLLAWLDAHEIKSQAALNELKKKDWQEILLQCMKVAAVTVSRAGANPPWKDELIK